jgi:hypothetical protein
VKTNTWPTAEFAALPVWQQLEGYAMEPDLLLDDEYAILRVSHEMTRLARLSLREQARHRSFVRSVAFWWPWTVLLGAAVSGLIFTSIQ